MCIFGPPKSKKNCVHPKLTFIILHGFGVLFFALHTFSRVLYSLLYGENFSEFCILRTIERASAVSSLFIIKRRFSKICWSNKISFLCWGKWKKINAQSMLCIWVNQYLWSLDVRLRTLFKWQRHFVYNWEPRPILIFSVPNN